MNREASNMVLSDDYLAMMFSFKMIFKHNFKIVVDLQKNYTDSTEFSYNFFPVLSAINISHTNI